MKLWDTETGQCLNRFSNGKIPYVVRFHPDDDKQKIFLAGMSDKKIIQASEISTGVALDINEDFAHLVRHQDGRNHARVRSAFGAGQHDHLRG